jgi:hypothetical protein
MLKRIKAIKNACTHIYTNTKVIKMASLLKLLLNYCSVPNEIMYTFQCHFSSLFSLAKTMLFES